MKHRVKKDKPTSSKPIMAPSAKGCLFASSENTDTPLGAVCWASQKVALHREV
jgi:hypothetical protein